jgi:hypothetical protein
MCLLVPHITKAVNGRQNPHLGFGFDFLAAVQGIRNGTD